MIEDRLAQAAEMQLDIQRELDGMERSELLTLRARLEERRRDVEAELRVIEMFLRETAPSSEAPRGK